MICFQVHTKPSLNGGNVEGRPRLIKAIQRNLSFNDSEYCLLNRLKILFHVLNSPEDTVRDKRNKPKKRKRKRNPIM